MKKILVTKMLWDFRKLCAGMHLESLGGAYVREVTGQTFSHNKELSLEFVIVGLAENFRWKIMQMRGTPDSQFHSSGYEYSEDNTELTITFYFDRRKGEDVCVTIYKAFLGVFSELGVDKKIWTNNHYYPVITQETKWKILNHDTIPSWITHGKKIAHEAALNFE